MNNNDDENPKSWHLFSSEDMISGYKDPKQRRRQRLAGKENVFTSSNSGSSCNVTGRLAETNPGEVNKCPTGLTHQNIPQSTSLHDASPMTRTPLSNITNISQTLQRAPLKDTRKSKGKEPLEEQVGCNLFEKYLKKNGENFSDLRVDPRSDLHEDQIEESIIEGLTYPEDGLFDSEEYDGENMPYHCMDTDSECDCSKSEMVQPELGRVLPTRRKRIQKIVPQEYASLGCPNVKCTHCSAQMWKEERVNKNVVKGTPLFSLSCKKGAVKLPDAPQTPAYLMSLYNDAQNSSSFQTTFSENTVENMINTTFSEFDTKWEDPKYLSERAILTPTNQTVGHLNALIVDKIPGESFSYFSVDSAEEFGGTDTDLNSAFRVEYLNSLNIPGVPYHHLKLKVGVVVMLMRNLNQSLGLCNGTRMIIRKCLKFCVEAEVISGSFVGTRHFIPRMELCPSDSRMPFKLVRKQMPLQICYAMTINKSQGQSLETVGLFLPKSVFTYGQFYVAISRVTSSGGLKIFVDDSSGMPTNITQNVVYREVFYGLPRV